MERLRLFLGGVSPVGFGGLPRLPEDVDEDAARGLALPLAFFRGVAMLSISPFFRFSHQFRILGITDEKM